MVWVQMIVVFLRGLLRDGAELALLSVTTFCTFEREFSPLGLREGRELEDTCADRGRCSSRTVFEEARTHTGLHIIEARRRFL